MFSKKNNPRYDRTRVYAPCFCFLDGATEFYPEYEEPVISEGMVCQKVMTEDSNFMLKKVVISLCLGKK